MLKKSWPQQHYILIFPQNCPFGCKSFIFVSLLWRQKNVFKSSHQHNSCKKGQSSICLRSKVTDCATNTNTNTTTLFSMCIANMLEKSWSFLFFVENFQNFEDFRKMRDITLQSKGRIITPNISQYFRGGAELSFLGAGRGVHPWLTAFVISWNVIKH